MIGYRVSFIHDFFLILDGNSEIGEDIRLTAAVNSIFYKTCFFFIRHVQLDLSNNLL